MKGFLLCCVFLLMLVGELSGCCLVVRSWWMDQYDSVSFNCVDMSYVLAPVFRHFGFDTRIVHGWTCDNGTGHCWLSLNGVYFDAVSLWFDDESEYTRITYVDRFPWATRLENGFLDMYQEEDEGN